MNIVPTEVVRIQAPPIDAGAFQAVEISLPFKSKLTEIQLHKGLEVLGVLCGTTNFEGDSWMGQEAGRGKCVVALKNGSDKLLPVQGVLYVENIEPKPVQPVAEKNPFTGQATDQTTDHRPQEQSPGLRPQASGSEVVHEAEFIDVVGETVPDPTLTENREPKTDNSLLHVYLTHFQANVLYKLLRGAIMHPGQFTGIAPAVDLAMTHFKLGKTPRAPGHSEVSLAMNESQWKVVTGILQGKSLNQETFPKVNGLEQALAKSLGKALR